MVKFNMVWVPTKIRDWTAVNVKQITELYCYYYWTITI